MPAIDVLDATWFGVRPAVLGAALGQPARWRRWWPGLTLAVDEARDEKGMRWFVRGVRGDDGLGLAGSAEVWVQPVFDGAVGHFFLRLDPAPGMTVDRRRAEQLIDEYRRLTKRAFWALADELDPGRLTRMTSASHTAVS